MTIAPILHPYRCQSKVLFLFPWIIYAIHYLLLLEILSIAVIETSTNPSTTNRYPIFNIISFISVEIVFNPLSNVRLLLGIFTRPQANASLWLYRQFMLRKVCNPLLESSRNSYPYNKAS